MKKNMQMYYVVKVYKDYFSCTTVYTPEYIAGPFGDYDKALEEANKYKDDKSIEIATQQIEIEF